MSRHIFCNITNTVPHFMGAIDRHFVRCNKNYMVVWVYKCMISELIICAGN